MRTPEDYFELEKPSLKMVLDHNSNEVQKMLEDSSFEIQQQEALYIYRLHAGDHVQTAVIAEVPVTEYQQGRIHRHEHTRSEHENRLTQYLQHVGVSSSHICLANQDEALLEFYRRLRPGEPPSVENAKALLENLFFNPRRYDLGRVGRYKLNRRLGIKDDPETSPRILSSEDVVGLLKNMILINRAEREPDDIDHLGNRRVRAVGELIQNHIRVGLMRMERVIKERMTTQMDPATTTPAALINILSLIHI